MLRLFLGRAFLIFNGHREDQLRAAFVLIQKKTELVCGSWLQKPKARSQGCGIWEAGHEIIESKGPSLAVGSRAG